MAPQLQVMLEDMISGVRDTLRGDIQNLQLDIIRQFHIQQRHTETLCERHPPLNKPCLGGASFLFLCAKKCLLACTASVWFKHSMCVTHWFKHSMCVTHCLTIFRRLACSTNVC